MPPTRSSRHEPIPSYLYQNSEIISIELPGLVCGLVEVVELLEGGAGEGVQQGHVVRPLVGEAGLQPLHPAGQPAQNEDIPDERIR